MRMSPDPDLSQGIRYRRHADEQMALRCISRLQVERALRHILVSYPAAPLRRTPERSMIYEGDVDGRTLKVYVLEGSHPPLVKTAAWKDA